MEDIKSGQFSKYGASAYLKLLLLSAFGIIAFFIDVPFPAYTVMGYAAPAQSTILANHVTNFIKNLFWNGELKIMHYIVYGIGIYAMIDLYVRKAKHFKTPVASAFSVFKMIGFVLLTFMVFDFGPDVISKPLASLADKSISQFILNSILISISISIPVASIFLPFLLDYGLVDLVGVILRGVMRPIFKLPGRAAVIMVSAFLGNFSIGHIAINDQYTNGRMTQREALVIGSSLSTVSVGFLMVLATNSGIMEYWSLYFWSAFLITLIITFIGVRIPPLSRVEDSCYPGVTPDPEPVYKKELLKHSIIEGLDIADAAQGPLRRIAFIQKETIGVLGTVVSGTAFFATVGVLLYTYTPIFSWIGYIFYPFLRLGLSSAEAGVAATGAAISFLEVTIPVLLVAAGEWSLRIRYILAVIPVTSIIFLASFIPCLMATEVPVKFSQLLIIWLERMLLSVIITIGFAILIFPA